MKPSTPNAQQIAARLSEARAKLTAALEKRDALTAQREAAARKSAAALRDHAAQMSGSNEDVEHCAAMVDALEIEHAVAVEAYAEAARQDRYARAAKESDTIKDMLTRRAAIEAEIRDWIGSADQVALMVAKANADLPAGAKHLTPVADLLDIGRKKFERHGFFSSHRLVAYTDAEYWAPQGIEPQVLPAPQPKIPSPASPTTARAMPQTQYAAGFEPGMRKVVSLPRFDSPSEPNAADRFDPSQRRHFRPAHLA